MTGYWEQSCFQGGAQNQWDFHDGIHTNFTLISGSRQWNANAIFSKNNEVRIEKSNVDWGLQVLIQ